jgi:hypothetical protein
MFYIAQIFNNYGERTAAAAIIYKYKYKNAMDRSGYAAKMTWNSYFFENYYLF